MPAVMNLSVAFFHLLFKSEPPRVAFGLFLGKGGVYFFFHLVLYRVFAGSASINRCIYIFILNL